MFIGLYGGIREPRVYLYYFPPECAGPPCSAAPTYAVFSLDRSTFFYIWFLLNQIFQLISTHPPSHNQISPQLDEDGGFRVRLTRVLFSPKVIDEVRNQGLAQAGGETNHYILMCRLPWTTDPVRVCGSTAIYER